MSSRHNISKYIIALLLLCCVNSTFSAEQGQRINALAKLYPEGLANIPLESQKKALKYITSWMNAFSTLSVSGLKNSKGVKQAYEQELLPLILPLKNGTRFEKDAYNAGTKIYDVFIYLGSKLSTKTTFDDAELNALIRYQPGSETDPSQLSSGISELFFDYFQLVAPDLFEQRQKQIKAQQN